MIKLVYIVSNIDKAISFEWLHNNLKNEFDITFIFLAPKFPLTGNYIKENGGKVIFIKFFGKKSYINVGLKLTFFLKKINPDIIHTHLRDADLIGLRISKLLGIKKRISTRHFSTFNKDYHPKSVKFDRLINKWTTDIIAISENVKDVLLEEGINASKISLIHHGLDLDKFQNVDELKINQLKEKYQTKGNYPVIGVISRYIKWKGHEYIIASFQKLLIEYPNAKLILANANGPLKKEIKKKLKMLPNDSYVEIAFEEDLFSLYNLFDVFVHTPINSQIEAFGQVYIESLAAKIPSIFTLSGIANEFIIHNKNAYVVNYKNSFEILKGMIKILEDHKYRENIISKGILSIHQFELDLFIQKLKGLYLE